MTRAPTYNMLCTSNMLSFCMLSREVISDIPYWSLFFKRMSHAPGKDLLGSPQNNNVCVEEPYSDFFRFATGAEYETFTYIKLRRNYSPA